MRKAINSIIEWIAIQKFIWRAKRNGIWSKIDYFAIDKNRVIKDTGRFKVFPH